MTADAESKANASEMAVCENCGRYDVIEFDGRKLCPDCYSERGACCAGNDDSAGR